MAELSPQDIKALEQTRQRLSQLTNSLGSLQQNILQADPLPPWYGASLLISFADYLYQHTKGIDRSSLQSLAAIISQHLASVSHHLNTHYDLFASMAVYPLPQFPGRTQENLLGQLLRKKLEPNVEDWVEKGRAVATEAAENGQSRGLKMQEMLDLWSWAGMAANEQARKHTWSGNYTLEEKERGIENVVTGLRRQLKENPDDSSDDEDDEKAMDDQAAPDGDEMEIVGARRKSGAAGLEFELRKNSEHKAPEALSKTLPLDDVLRFMMTGAEPRG